MSKYNSRIKPYNLGNIYKTPRSSLGLGMVGSGIGSGNTSATISGGLTNTYTSTMTDPLWTLSGGTGGQTSMDPYTPTSDQAIMTAANTVLVGINPTGRTHIRSNLNRLLTDKSTSDIYKIMGNLISYINMFGELTPVSDSLKTISRDHVKLNSEITWVGKEMRMINTFDVYTLKSLQDAKKRIEQMTNVMTLLGSDNNGDNEIAMELLKNM